MKATTALELSRSERRRDLTMTWIGVLAGPAIVQILAGFASSSPGTARPTLAFTILALGGAGAALLSLLMVLRARESGERELGYLGTFFFAIGVMALGSGIATPGFVFDDNTAADALLFWAVPLAAVVGAPAALPSSDLRDRIDATWQTWVMWSLAAVVAIVALVVVLPDMLVAPRRGSLWTAALALSMVAIAAWWSYRHLQLAVVAKSATPLVVAGAYACVGAAALMWWQAEPYSFGHWLAMLLVVVGPAMAAMGASHAYKRTERTRALLAPVLDLDHRGALELGIDPLVHEFLTDFGTKDPVTRHHVLRTRDLAGDVARKLELDRDRQREVLLAAIFHDVGKLVIPAELLSKKTPLTDVEYGVMKRHPNYGANMLEASPVLAAIAPAVRAHHERIDGSGYPNGLQGSQIPLAARIVAVCDAYDAMINSRRYRTDLSVETALDTLERNASLWWDRRVVEVVVRGARHRPPTKMPEMMDAIGRIGCDCIPDPDALHTYAA